MELSQKYEVKKVSLDALRVDGGTQARARIDMGVVSEYAEALQVGAELPPVVAFHDGAEQWLADGFHRFHAHRAAKRTSIDVIVREGTLRDAILFSLGANRTHGLRRTNADKRKAVESMLRDAEWVKWSDRKIAEICGVSNNFVSERRKVICPSMTDAPAIRTVERGGKTYKQNTTRIGKDAAKTTEKAETFTPAPAPVPHSPIPAASDRADSDQHDLDLLAELESAHARITELTAEIQAAEADDLKAEAMKWRRSCEHAQRQQAEAMDRAKGATEREAWTMRQLRRCGKAVGEDDPKKIAAAVEALALEHHKAGA